MNFVELYLQMIKEQRTGAIEAASGKKKWLFYFLDGGLALTKSNIKPEQTSSLKEQHPNIPASDLMLKQASMRVQRALLAESIKEHSNAADKNLNISSLDALAVGMSEAYSEEELAEMASDIADLRPKPTRELSFSDGEIVSFLSSLKGSLRSGVAVSNSGVSHSKAWATLWIAHNLDALEKDESEPEETLGDMLDFDLDSLLEQEVAKVDEVPDVPIKENAEGEEKEEEGEETVSKEDLLKDTLEELENHILEAEHHFEVLGVGHDVDPEEFRTSFRDLSMRLHPDRFVDGTDEIRDRATTLFDRVREAYEVLSDEEQRIKYTNQVIHGQMSEEEEAMEQLQAYWKAEAAFNKGKTLFNQGQLARAHDYFKEAAESSPETLEFLAYYGYTTFSVNRNSNLKQAEIGLGTLKEVLELNKEQEIKLDSAWTLMGRAYRENNSPDKARRALKQALRINPSNPDAVREMKRLTGQSGPQKKKKKDSQEESKGGFFSRLFGKK